uniref:Type IV conjugative transfer system protein TraL n=1 Tax=Panagrellus redivivus TaxID=6233 RepID=A0A7E4VGL0_PANRE
MDTVWRWAGYDVPATPTTPPPPAYTLADLNPIELFFLLVLSFIHLIILTIIAIIVGIYHAIISIYVGCVWMYNNPDRTKQIVYYARLTYDKGWWTFWGVYRFLTEPPPPPVFHQKTLGGGVKISEKNKEHPEWKKRHAEIEAKKIN